MCPTCLEVQAQPSAGEVLDDGHCRETRRAGIAAVEAVARSVGSCEAAGGGDERRPAAAASGLQCKKKSESRYAPMTIVKGMLSSSAEMNADTQSRICKTGSRGEGSGRRECSGSVPHAHAS